MTQPLTIREDSRTPKYRQIVDAIIDRITRGELHIDDRIPSINALSERYGLSRDTVEKAYKVLKQRNVITAVKGKGFYVARAGLIDKVNVLFLVNKLSSYKMRIYNAFVARIGTSAHVDLHIYHCDEGLFLDIMDRFAGRYDYLVVMPHFKTEDQRHISATEEVLKSLNAVPSGKLILLDNDRLDIDDAFATIYQDFERDIYGALLQGVEKISRFKRMILAYPPRSVYPYPRRILFGVRRFCREQGMDFEVIDKLYEDTVLHCGDLFITIEESDLVTLVKQLKDRGLQPGRDIGIISYNDTPLKDLLGIAVVSTDFDRMGQTAAESILERHAVKVKNPFRLIERESI